MIVLQDVTGAATALAEDLGARLERLGVYRFERRPWLPHVTVLRFRRGRPAADRSGAGERSSIMSSVRLSTFVAAAQPGRSTRSLETVALGGLDGGSRGSTRHGARTDRAAVRQGRRHEDERPGAGVDRRGLDRLALARPRARRRRAAARPRRRGVRPRVVGQDDPRLPRDRRGAAPRRHLRLHRRRARDGSGVRQADRRQHRRAARLAARHGRAGARDLRAARALRARSTSSRSTRSPR